MIASGVPDKVSPTKVGDALVLKFCGVLMVMVFEVPDITIPLLLEKLTTPLLEIARPIVPLYVVVDGVFEVVIS